VAWFLRKNESIQTFSVTMKDNRSEIANWLRSAHAMECNLAEMLEGQVERLVHFPSIQQQIITHAAETRRHADLVEGALRSIGEDISLLKDGAATLSGMLSPIAMGMADDAPVKIVLSNYAAEHFEIACYRSLIAAAELAEYPQVVSVCREILTEEEATARLLEPAITEVTTTYLRNL
jgi:ferritin-like metal-binding protein YciE